MAKEIEKEQVKKVRRGITNETKAVANLRFHEKDAAPNGLFMGQLEEVKVSWSVGSEGAFAGVKVPRLEFHFTSLHTNDVEKRHVYQTIFPIESNVLTIPGGKDAWRVDNVFNWCKHILDVILLKGRKLTDDEQALLALPFDDADDEGQYVEVDPQDVANGYGVLFTNVANLLNNDGKPAYKDANGRPVKLWMKLIRHKKDNKNGWRDVAKGELAFDTFPGNGAIELVKENQNPTILRLDLSKESIIPMQTKKPTIGGNSNINTPMGGVMVDPAQSQMQAINTDFSNSEMPF